MRAGMKIIASETAISASNPAIVSPAIPVELSGYAPAYTGCKERRKPAISAPQYPCEQARIPNLSACCGSLAAMNSFELNKIMGAVLFTCLCLLSLNIAAGEKAGAPAQSVPIAQLLASADVKKGENSAKKCQACHTFEKGGPNRVGPNLYGIVGEPRGQGRGGFNFSAAMKAKGGDWTIEDLDAFIKSPKTFIPGTAMSFAGITKDSERADVLAYLNTLSDSPKPLPKAAEAK
jgi:cytochrome c